MRSKPSSAFTLIEVVTTMAIIVILAGIVVSLSGFVMNKASRSRAKGEMAMLSAALESYKADTGGYPQEVGAAGAAGVTDTLSPKQHYDPTNTAYEKSSLFLYKQLTGDLDANGIPDTGVPAYLTQYDRKKLLMTVNNPTTGAITSVRGFQDPWGYFYGYSTAAAREERLFQNALKMAPNTARKTSSDMPGFNAATYDLWTTAGAKSSPITAPALQSQEWAKWEKNW